MIKLVSRIMPSHTIISGNETQTINAFVVHLLKAIESLAPNRDFITIGLSGGSFIKLFSDEMAKQKDKFQAYHDKLRFLLCDERFVPLNHSDSTYYGFLSNNLFKNLNIPNEHVYPIKADASSVEECAKDYEARIRPLLNKHNGFDILVLGMGPDGHTCSLFPNHPLFLEAASQTNLVLPISDSPKPPPARVTLTLNYINNSDYLMFFSVGEGKAEMLRKILTEKDLSLPSANVQPKRSDATLLWFIDKPASRLL